MAISKSRDIPMESSGNGQLELARKAIAQFAQAAKEGARLLDLAHQRRHRHQAAQFEMRHQQKPFGQSRKLLGIAAGFLRRRIEPHLDEHGQAAAVAGAAFQFFRQGQRVQRINLVKQAEGARGLVALEVPDQVPSRGHVRQERGLGFPLLRATFAEVAHAGGKGLLHALGRDCFGDSNEGDLFGAAAGTSGGPLDPFAHARHIRGDRFRLLDHRRDSNRLGAKAGC